VDGNVTGGRAMFGVGIEPVTSAIDALAALGAAGRGFATGDDIAGGFSRDGMVGDVMP
jgi:hypothetical protein